MKKYLLFIAPLLLSGCVFDTFDQGLPMFKGKKIDQVVEYFGPPDQEQSFGDKKFYTWQRDMNTTVTSPVTTQSNGYVGNTNVWGHTTTWQAQPVNYNCKIQFQTSKSGIIQKWSYDGNVGGCVHYEDGLKRFMADQGIK